MNICINLVVCVWFYFCCFFVFFNEDYFSLASRGQSIRRDIPGQQTAKFLPRLHLNPLGQLCLSQLTALPPSWNGFPERQGLFPANKNDKESKIISKIHFRLMYMYF